MVRKHRGINPKTGKLKVGFRYSGKTLKNGAAQIIKAKEGGKRKNGAAQIKKNKKGRKGGLKGGSLKVGGVLVPQDLADHYNHYHRDFPKETESCLKKVMKDFENAGQDADKGSLESKWFKCMDDKMPWDWAA